MPISVIVLLGASATLAFLPRTIEQQAPNVLSAPEQRGIVNNDMHIKDIEFGTHGTSLVYESPDGLEHYSRREIELILQIGAQHHIGQKKEELPPICIRFPH